MEHRHPHRCQTTTVPTGAEHLDRPRQRPSAFDSTKGRRNQTTHKRARPTTSQPKPSNCPAPAKTAGVRGKREGGGDKQANNPQWCLTWSASGGNRGIRCTPPLPLDGRPAPHSDGSCLPSPARPLSAQSRPSAALQKSKGSVKT